MQPDIWQQVDGLFERWDRADSPGIAVGVYRNGQLEYGRGFGCAHLEQRRPIDTDTVFHVASLSKQFTALVAAMLAEEGWFSLDDDLRDFVPELPPGPPITYRHAIHHTSGLREQWDMLRLAGWRDADLKTTDDILSLVARQRAANFLPGKRFQYINTAYTLVAVAIERATGETLRAQAERLIFGPLGMRRSFFLDDHAEIVADRAQAYRTTRSGGLGIDVPHFETVGPTGLHTTIADMALWERNLMTPSVASAELIEAMMVPGRFAEGAVTNYAFGFVVGHHGTHATIEHAGGDAAFRAYYLRVPEERFAVLLLANFLEIGPGRIARKIVDIGLPQPNGDPARTSTRPIDAKLPAGLEQISGRYRHAASGLTCRVGPRGGQLFLESNGGSYELVPTGGLSFDFRDMDVHVSFAPAQAGAASSMSISSGGNTVNVCERVEIDSESNAAPLEDYAGRFRSEELDVIYTVAVQRDILRMQGPRGMLIRLRRISGDGFAALDTTLDVQFRRDQAGRIEGYLLSSERAWNIGFSRV